jgi:hypothetical protein
MQGLHHFESLRGAVTLAAFSLVLSGCLSEDKAEDDKAEVLITNNVTGSVGDGPVVGAAMRVVKKDGGVLHEFVSDTFADFDIAVKTKAGNYPLTIEARDGTDLVTNLAPDFTLFGAVPEATEQTTANVNPFSTFTVELAKDMSGGLTVANLDAAEQIITTSLNSGLTSLVTTGPSSTPIDASNIAEIIKASEALAETVRRTRDLLQQFGNTTSGNDVIRELSADLIDEIIDGLGAPETDARTAAISTVVSIQVLLESMANELHVNGVDATDAMTSALNVVLDGEPETGIEDQTASPEMLDKVNIGLAAAVTVSNDPALAELRQIVNGLQAGMDASLVQTLLPGDYRATLDSLLSLVAGGDIAVINAVNNVVRNGGEEPPPNRAPTISGTPSANATTGSNYLFVPSTSDADGDALQFSITNMPTWASFNTETGTLSGIPISSDAGTYTGIVISATDGLESVSLAAFSINVVLGNQAPSISGTPPTQVNTGSQYSFTPTADDADGDSLTFSITNRPSWATFSSTTGRLSGTPARDDDGNYPNIVISVTDGQASASLPAFAISVIFVNGAPTISGNPASQVSANSQYSFTPTASDPNGDNLTFSVSGLPGWADFNTSTGRISGTPTDANIGVYSNISITVSDGTASSTLGPFSITVNAISLGSVTLNWTPPTENEDGSTLEDLDGYKIYWGTSQGNYPNSVTIDGGLSSYVVDNLAPGTYVFVATSFNTSGVESVYSNPATKVVN